MTPEKLRSTLSAYFDGDLSEEEVEGLFGSDEARYYLAHLSGLRRAIRYEPADPGPDVTARVLARIRTARVETRQRRLRMAAAFAAGIVAGVVFIGAAVRQPVQVAVAGIPDQVLAAQSEVLSLTARLRIVERGWHPEIPERTYEGAIEYLAPETLRVTINDLTSYPSAEWVPNHSEFVVDEDRAWSTWVPGCPTESLPGCMPDTPRATNSIEREPFPEAAPAPLDLIVPVGGFSRASQPTLIGLDEIDGRAAVGVEVSAAQAVGLLQGLISLGNWREVHPTDRVELWLDDAALVPLAMRVYPADDAERALWAVRKGYQDEIDQPILEVIWSEVSDNEIDDISLSEPPTTDPETQGFADGSVAGLDRLIPGRLPEGMTLHRTGVIRGGTGPEVSAASWSDGRAWLKLRWTGEWPGGRLFGDLGTLVRQEGVGPGVGYLDERGDRVAIHGGDVDLLLVGSLPTADLLDVASSINITGLPVPEDWAEAATATPETAVEEVPGLLVPDGLTGFGPPAIRTGEGIATLSYAGPGNRGFLLTEAVDGILTPPLEAKPRGVEVRGTEGRYSPDHGLLEWVEDELTVSLTSTTLTLDELLAIADMLREP
jgi:hypothetical protein